MISSAGLSFDDSPFISDKDIAAYAHWLTEGAVKYELSVHGWVFMTP